MIKIDHQKRVWDTEKVVHIIAAMKDKEIYFEPLLWEVMRVLHVEERAAKEYILTALVRNNLSKTDIQWYDKRFMKPTLNENQRRLKRVYEFQLQKRSKERI